MNEREQLIAKMEANIANFRSMAVASNAPNAWDVEIRENQLVLAALRQQGEPVAWIPVSERLPEKETPVLALVNGQMQIAEIRWETPTFEETFKAFWYWDNPYNDGEDWEVTHWQPLPEPPKAMIAAKP